MLFTVLMRLVAQGKTEGLREKIDVFFAVGSLTEEQYQTLVETL